MDVKKILIDMDGVLADFDRGVRELCGIEPLNQEINNPQAVRNRLWEAVRGIDHFYNRLEFKPGAERMFRLINIKYSSCCEILSSVPNAKRGLVTAGDDKITWVRRLLSKDIPVNIVYREEKKFYCTGRDCILIDDCSRNIKEWEEYGGTGVLHKDADETIRTLKAMGLVIPETVEELIEIWKEKKEKYRKGFNNGWPAKLVETIFVLGGKEYSLTPVSFGMDKYDPWDHGLMEYFQGDLGMDLKAIGATRVCHLGFID